MCLPDYVLVDVIRPAFFTRYAGASDTAVLGKMFNLLTKLAAFFFFPFAVGVLVLGDKMTIYVFGAKYLDSLVTLWIVVLFAASNVFMTSTGLVLQSTEKVQVQLYSKIFAVYNLVADLLVVRPFGVVGVALATGSAVLLKNLFCYYYAKKHGSLRVDWKGLSAILANSALMGLALYPLRHLATSLPWFLLVTLLGLVVYGLLAFVNKGFSEEERALLNKVSGKRVFVF